MALAGAPDIESANRHLSEVCTPAFNAEFAQPAREPGSAFVPCRDPAALDDVLCEVHERTVGRDNCVHFDELALQLPADRRRAHYMKARVKVRRHADGTLSVWHGPRRLAKYAATGAKPDQNPNGADLKRQLSGREFALRKAPKPCPRPPQQNRTVYLL